jgi:MarR-like DNA-binding transcriptional regulator SgrR of sgrS sRNA
MPFSYPVDPARIQIIPDLDVSYALASTLVEWDASKQLSAGLASSWKIVSPNTYRFTLRKDAKWSNGTAITSNDVKKSFERGLKAHPTDLRGLAQILESIECPNNNEVDFKLKTQAQESGLLGKLTEPNYGVLRVDEKGNLNLEATSGPYSLSPQSDRSMLTLLRNPLWYRWTDTHGNADRVVIKRAPDKMDSQTLLLADEWPNLIETSSLIDSKVSQQYEAKKFQIWKRPLDKFCHFQLSRRLANADGRALLKFLRNNLQSSEVVAGLSGYSLADQFFPKGYQLHDAGFSCKKDKAVVLPKIFSSKPIEILISPERITPALKENIRKTILKTVGVEPKFISVSLDEIRKTKVKGEYDLYAGTVGLADPDPEGAMSFYLEGEAPVIRSEGTDFLARLDSARKEKNSEKRVVQMRTLLRDAVCDGHVLPLFHLSTVGIGRPEMDFSGIPTSDESVTLSRIQFRSR